MQTCQNFCFTFVVLKDLLRKIKVFIRVLVKILLCVIWFKLCVMRLFISARWPACYIRSFNDSRIYYQLLRESNSESKEVIEDDTVMRKSRVQFGGKVSYFMNFLKLNFPFCIAFIVLFHCAINFAYYVVRTAQCIVFKHFTMQFHKLFCIGRGLPNKPKQNLLRWWFTWKPLIDISHALCAYVLLLPLTDISNPYQYCTSEPSERDKDLLERIDTFQPDLHSDQEKYQIEEINTPG